MSEMQGMLRDLYIGEALSKDFVLSTWVSVCVNMAKSDHDSMILRFI